MQKKRACRVKEIPRGVVESARAAAFPGRFPAFGIIVTNLRLRCLPLRQRLGAANNSAAATGSFLALTWVAPASRPEKVRMARTILRVFLPKCRSLSQVGRQRSVAAVSAVVCLVRLKRDPQGVDFNVIAREWRMKWSSDNDKKSLADAQAALVSVLANVWCPC